MFPEEILAQYQQYNLQLSALLELDEPSYLRDYQKEVISAVWSDLSNRSTSEFVSLFADVYNHFREPIDFNPFIYLWLATAAVFAYSKKQSIGSNPIELDDKVIDQCQNINDALQYIEASGDNAIEYEKLDIFLLRIHTLRLSHQMAPRDNNFIQKNYNNLGIIIDYAKTTKEIVFGRDSQNATVDEQLLNRVYNDLVLTGYHYTYDEFKTKYIMTPFQRMEIFKKIMDVDKEGLFSWLKRNNPVVCCFLLLETLEKNETLSNNIIMTEQNENICDLCPVEGAVNKESYEENSIAIEIDPAYVERLSDGFKFYDKKNDCYYKISNEELKRIGLNIPQQAEELSDDDLDNALSLLMSVDYSTDLLPVEELCNLLSIDSSYKRDLLITCLHQEAVIHDNEQLLVWVNAIFQTNEKKTSSNIEAGVEELSTLKIIGETKEEPEDFSCLNYKAELSHKTDFWKPPKLKTTDDLKKTLTDSEVRRRNSF